MNEDTIRKKVFKLIDKKKEYFLERDNHLDSVSSIIKYLNKYINTKVELTDNKIKEQLEFLIHYRVVLDIPLPADTLLLRAVRIEDYNKYPSEYESANRISYIPRNMPEKAKLGRFNKNGESIYYGCISSDIKNSNVAFSETNAQVGEYVNILVSNTNKELKVRFIGLLDYYKKGTEPPFSVHSFFKEVYRYYQDTHDTELLTAIELCDTFFADITTRKNSDRLYNVTSILASIFLEDKEVDGLIYPSVETVGSPNLALKPSSVDNKVTHKEARVFLIKKDYGYSIYYAISSDQIGIVDKDNTINWKTI